MLYILILIMTLWAVNALADQREATPPLPVKQFSNETNKAIAEYRAAYAAYQQATQAYERQASDYWDLVDAKRQARRKKRAAGKAIELADYVPDQPPVYSGPREPAQPPVLPPRAQPKKKPPKRGLPVVADFLREAKTRYKFVPERAAVEIDYKRAYARAALAAGISKEQAVRIYGFEAGGNGPHDVQAGLESKKKGAKPISTALGYNQLLVANTIGLLAAHGADFITTLTERAAAAAGSRRKALNGKISALRSMVKFARSFPYRWATHVQIAQSAKGWGVHALILDIDIGPLLQTQKLFNSLSYAKRGGYDRPLTAAELELMNLTGDGNGFDMLTMPAAMRDKVPTANFFQRGGYERNPVASRNNVVASLIAAMDRRMDSQAALDGSKELAAAFQEVEQGDQQSNAPASAAPAGTTLSR